MFPQLGSRASQALAYLPVPAITGSSPVALSLYSVQRPRRERPPTSRLGPAQPAERPYQPPATGNAGGVGW
jgi:hypothetical protein